MLSSLEEMDAIVVQQKDYGFARIAAHGDDGMQRAIKAGVKTIEHGTKLMPLWI
jgi:imidazolonepropionase-like amidohydrolase